MKRIIVAATLLALSGFSASAQQVAPQPTPAEFALQASQMIMQLGQLAQAQQKHIDQQNADLAKAQARIKELEASPAKK